MRRPAYIRPFVPSKIRERLDEMAGSKLCQLLFKHVHELVRKYRNTTVAHSKSDLAVPVPVAVRDATGQVVNVIEVSLIQPMPRFLAERFQSLISVMQEALAQRRPGTTSPAVR